MIEVFENLFVGDQPAYHSIESTSKGWYIVQACKEPYHRRALGYGSRGAPKGHPEYYRAYRDNRMICNLVDAPDPKYFDEALMKEIIEFIHFHLGKRDKVLIHCNQGLSRSPSIAFFYLRQIGLYDGMNFEEAEVEFKKIYPPYSPMDGIRRFVFDHWDEQWV